MSQLDNIKKLAREGYRITEVAEKAGVDIKTAKKYLTEVDYSPKPPIKETSLTKLDIYKETILSWLEEDRKYWHKQRHTAQRIHDRLLEEVSGYNCSYSTVQRFVKEQREAVHSRANQELLWEPGIAEVDFGEADFCEHDVLTRKKYLTVSFPHSNDGFSQVFGGETAECVCQGLKDIFEYIGGVPHLLIFDNATGVGRRVGDKIREAELFLRFRVHNGFSVRFCNPDSGHEKGNVERKVGYTRSNLFVPIPRFDDIQEFNRQLLKQHEKKAGETHYKKGVIIRDLFKEDQASLLPLPLRPFNVCRYEWLMADGYGKICLDGRHHYSTRPEFGKQEVLTAIRAHTVDVLMKDGSLLVSHIRKYGDQRTDTIDYSTSLSVLMHNVGAWSNSGLRGQIPDQLRQELDGQARQQLKESLRMMHALSKQYGFEAAISAMQEAVSRGRLNMCDTAVLAARMTGYGLMTLPEAGPNLTAYDKAFLVDGGDPQ